MNEDCILRENEDGTCAHKLPDTGTADCGPVVCLVIDGLSLDKDEAKRYLEKHNIALEES